ncbi:MAG: hypothetical protein JXC33_03055 [Deltaproteobacteria bacterium]|nr:hypothetical protein [Deltaproteobacteria bacterium]
MTFHQTLDTVALGSAFRDRKKGDKYRMVSIEDKINAWTLEGEKRKGGRTSITENRRMTF